VEFVFLMIMRVSGRCNKMLNGVDTADRLVVMSIQAQNQDAFVPDMAAYLSKKIGITAVSPVPLPWQERERLFDAGEIQVGWICGLPYGWKADSGQPPIELLAAPVRGMRRNWRKI
jgi:phosphonate transport system substrate-binding protein